MADTRELILSRIMIILEDLDAVIHGETDQFTTIARNRGELTPDERPALVLFDGGEVVNEGFLGKRGAAARLVTMTPQVAVVLDDRQPVNLDTGQDLNAMRGPLIHAISTDAELQTLVGANGSIDYAGQDTDLAWNLPLDGTHVHSFAIVYPFFPSRL
jgi:hypothetical protein